MKERDIRKLLKKRVEEYGGEVRAVCWVGRPNAPDVLCLFPVGSSGYMLFGRGDVWVETKAPGENPRPAQSREHDRMRIAGCCVEVIRSPEQIDEFIPGLPSE